MMKKVSSDYSKWIFVKFFGVVLHFINVNTDLYDMYEKYGSILRKNYYKVLEYVRHSQILSILKIMLNETEIFYCIIIYSDEIYTYNIYKCFSISPKIKDLTIVSLISISKKFSEVWKNNEFVAICKHATSEVYQIYILYNEKKKYFKNHKYGIILKEKMNISYLFYTRPKNISIKKTSNKNIEIDISNYGKVIYSKKTHTYTLILKETSYKKNREDRFEYIFAKYLKSSE